MFLYRAYELNFLSEVELAGIEPANQSHIPSDVVIRLGSVPLYLDGSPADNTYYQVGPDEVLLRIEGVARYLITGGSRIVVAPSPDARPNEVRLFLLGSAMGALLYQRALLPLHGSAVETSYGAMVFIGPSGIGKSTLAAHFQLRGYRLLSDDVCALTLDASGQVQVLPAFPKLRLCADAFGRLGESAVNAHLAKFDEDKYVLPLGRGYCPQPLNLAAVHLLTPHEQQEIILTPVHGFARADLLLSNLYRPEYLRGLATEGSVMRLASQIIRKAEVVEVRRRRDPDRIEELIDRLERKWLGCEITSFQNGNRI